MTALDLDRFGAFVVVLARDGSILEWNRTCVELTGEPLDEVRGRPFWELALSREESQRVKQVLREVVRERAARPFQCTLGNGGGQRTTVAFSAATREPEDRIVLTGVDVTEVIEDQRAELCRLRGLLDQAPEGILVFDLEGRILEVNDTACAMLGYSRQELTRKDLAEIVGARDLDRLRRARAHGSSPVHLAECRLRQKDGSHVPVEVSGRHLSDGRWQVFVRDVTERKRLERSLRESHADLARAQFVAKIGSWRLDASGRGIVGSDEMYRVLGMPRAATPMRLEELFAHVHPDDRAEVERSWLTALRGRPYDLQHRIVVGDAVKWVRSKAHLELDEDGSLRHGIGILQDITDQKWKEHQREFLAKAGAVLMTSTGECDAMLTELGRLATFELADYFVIDLVEPGSVRRLRVACSESVRRDLADALACAPLDPGVRRLTSDALETRRPVLLSEPSSSDLSRLADGGAPLLRELPICSLLVVPLLARGRLLGAFALISSRASRRYGERDLPFAEELARVCALAVDNVRLYESARRAVAARDEVLGIVAHDLRNPLGAILLQLQVMAARAGGRERRSQRAVEAIHRAATRMNALIQDMLDVANLERGSLAIEPRAIAVRPLIEEALEVHRERASRADLRLRLDLIEPLPEVLGDHGRLLRVLDHLLGNAIDFTPHGGEIAIGATSRQTEVLFSVSDTGPGIAAEQLPHLFDRFSRGEDTGDRRGAGLGLPIAKGVIEAHGGRLFIESGVERGTTIYFTLPVRSESAR